MAGPLPFTGPYLPLGYDFGLPNVPLEDTSFPLPVDEFGYPLIMTRIPLGGFQPDAYYSHDVPYNPAQNAPTTSPGQQHAPSAGTGGSDSLSPDDASGHALTPSSPSNFSPYIGDFDDSDVIAGSPESDQTIAADYVYVQDPSRYTEHMGSTNQAPRSSSRLPPSAQSSSHLRDGSGPSPHDNLAMEFSQQWTSLASPFGASMGELTTNAYNPFLGSGDFGLFEDSALLPNMADSNFDSTFGVAPQHQQTYANVPFRKQGGGVHTSAERPSSQSQSLAATTSRYTNNLSTYAAEQGQAQYAMNANNSMLPSSSPPYSGSAINKQHHRQRGPSASQVPQILVRNNNGMLRDTANAAPQAGCNQRAPAPSRANGHARARVQVRPAPTNSGDDSPQRYDGFDFTGSYPVIAAADPMRTHLHAQRVSPADKVSKGGRKKNSHLPVTSRERIHAMRKVGACWRCVMQRDPCDAPEGGCCSRCVMRASKGQTYYFDCDRSKLPDFVAEFLPESLLFEHQKQGIESFVSSAVAHWHVDNCIDVYLSSGYGPPLRWRLYEFTPKDNEFLFQLQMVQDPQSRRSLTREKYSPPYGLMRIDSVDDRNYESYLEDLLHPQWLAQLGESAYAEENLVDDGMFQCKVLDLMCTLHINTPDETLKPLLGDVLRMIIITYIMGHTLCITEDTLHPVIGNIRHSPKPPAMQKFTSPRLANRQLKFFFHVVRNNIYEKVLKWQQHTLHTGGKKQTTWLHTFCVTLGFAMVLEEVQRTIQCQAEAKICRQEATLQSAYNEAYQQCENIDKRFKLLVGLFQCKYRDRTWGDRGSFGNGTPEFRDPAASDFLHNLRGLVEQREHHLRERENVRFSLENQCLYTTRLTARFLLPFLSLPSA